jgi:hypothetical protein
MELILQLLLLLLLLAKEAADLTSVQTMVTIAALNQLA